jgi:bifunctional DNA-binding transcriptional regulator/antitoxin component of YhaV-PrlF toxin-antitoxin module
MWNMASTEYTSEVTKGQIPIPSELREEMALKDGAKVTLKREGDRLIVQAADASDPVDAFRGITKGAGDYRDREHRKDRFS